MVLVTLRTGWTLEYTLALDVLTFNAFVARMVRLHYREKAQDVWASATAMQAGFTGDKSGLERLTNAWLGKRGSTGDDLAREQRSGGGLR